MRNLFLLSTLLILHQLAQAGSKFTPINYNPPDSVKAVQIFIEVKVIGVNGDKKYYTGIQTDVVKLFLQTDKQEKKIVFKYPKSASVISTGKEVDISKRGEISCKYNWKLNESYKLLISLATDSIDNFSLYSGYVWLPQENKWKHIGTSKITGRWNTIQQPGIINIAKRKGGLAIDISSAWCQRQNGSWKNLKEDNQPAPVINLMSHIDSVSQRQTDIKIINDAIASGKTDATNNEQGVYYSIIKEGTGRQVLLTDTVTVFYKGYLFSDNSIFDQTKDKPISFPLNRLIKGWQIGIPLSKVGGKIKLVIPSDIAYSIRTRSAKIPPNSILVFEIEVVDAKQLAH
ncbi:MAG: FKBP-type peptidyl-prolyl cis-trans isomerase [Chitinophagaceae bacterium]|nr:FKBP-type peptidyl-prolyl cis-trans isomerase [Chitinophagaceae bacterium]MBP7109374.1 FKBP-type peptidyl-prolyl cis-trans isomerase [Chitinophagaceae bacterium]MBP7315514.1 FKBP-type peptidyl-prolyl cis-trans isomerase [Chitinophagaceae bacterium]HQX96126.1 FKBP-type peptidyl-prolyl cis-trans isomerase [Chitinophagaceae bacterium]HQZ50586.1 FKBP-type peptidyl-prolyl cis-trans isomerase [Chitinophagaceae bacterium]